MENIVIEITFCSQVMRGGRGANRAIVLAKVFSSEVQRGDVLKHEASDARWEVIGDVAFVIRPDALERPLLLKPLTQTVCPKEGDRLVVIEHRPAQSQRPLSVPTFSQLERVLSLLLFCLVTPFEFLLFAFDTEDCRGPGAPYPGGCPEYSAITDSRFYLLCLLWVAFLVGIFALRIGLRRRYRLLILAAYVSLLAFGWLFIWLPPLPPK